MGDQSMQQKPTGAVNPVQDAIRILSFRMPSTVGASGITPQQNMQGPTALGGQLGGFPGSNPSLIDFLQRLFGGRAAGPMGAPPSAPGMPSAPPMTGPGVNVTPQTPPGIPPVKMPEPGTLDRTTPDTGSPVSIGQSPFGGFNPPGGARMPGMKF
jgi:hypothetical protein